MSLYSRCGYTGTGCPSPAECWAGCVRRIKDEAVIACMKHAGHACVAGECCLNPQEEIVLTEKVATKLETTLVSRANRYGDFRDVGSISQRMLEVAQMSPGWNRMDAFQREGTTMILHKLARALSGDPNYADNWHDIAGYAKLVEDRLPTE